MNFIVIDSDSNLRKKLKSENEIKKLLDTSKDRVCFLDNSALSDAKYELSSIYNVSGFDRLVFITSFSSGVMAYHRNIFVNNKDFKKLTISAVDLENNVYQDQIINELNSVLAGEKILYNILIDSSNTLALTSKECHKVVNTKKRFSVISKNRPLAKKVSNLLGKLLSDWQVIFTEEPNNETYDDSNMVILVGEKLDDFSYEAPKSGMGKYLVWFNVNKLGYDEVYLSNIKFSIKEVLIDLGWNIHLNSDVFISNITYEEIRANILTESNSISSFIGNEQFVMWDKFGLPATNTQQNEESTQRFLDRICCFKMISGRAL